MITCYMCFLVITFISTRGRSELVWFREELFCAFVNSCLFDSILYKTKLPFIVVMNKVRSLPVCCCATDPLTRWRSLCFFFVFLRGADWHHRPQLRRGVDAGLWGLPGRPEPGDVVREQPDALHEPGAGRVLRQSEGETITPSECSKHSVLGWGRSELDCKAWWVAKWWECTS